MSRDRRLFQDNHFVVAGFEGLAVDALIGVVDAELPRPDTDPIVVYLKVQGRPWQRFYVEAWAGFWEERMDLAEEDGEGEGVRLVDYAKMYAVRHRRIVSIVCVDGQIRLAIEASGTFVLQHVDTGSGGSTNRLVFEAGS